jgi:hypothetical protein
MRIMGRLLARADIHYVTWAFFDHGKKADGLIHDQSSLNVNDFKQMFGRDIRPAIEPSAKFIADKSVFVILDACASGSYAEAAIGDELLPKNMAVLATTGSTCRSSLVVVSDDVGLVHRGTSGPDYRRQPSPMVQRLLDIIAYEACDPPISALPKILRERYAASSAFEACYFCKGTALNLRHFFAGRIPTEQEVSVVDGPVKMSEILRPLPLGGPIFDDASGRTECVRVRRDSSDPRTEVRVEVISHGKLGDKGDGGNSESEQKVLADIQTVRRGAETGHRAGPPLHELIAAIARDDRVSRLCSNDWPPDWRKIVDEIAEAVVKVSDVWKTNVTTLFPLVPCWRMLKLPEWKAIINRAGGIEGEDGENEDGENEGGEPEGERESTE